METLTSINVSVAVVVAYLTFVKLLGPERRAEWWSRYTRAVEQINSGRPNVEVAGWLCLKNLANRPLTEKVDAELIYALANGASVGISNNDVQAACNNAALAAKIRKEQNILQVKYRKFKGLLNEKLCSMPTCCVVIYNLIKGLCRIVLCIPILAFEVVFGMLKKLCNWGSKKP